MAKRRAVETEAMIRWPGIRQDPLMMGFLGLYWGEGAKTHHQILRAAAVDGGIGKAQQSDVDAKVAEIKTAYKDEYAPLLAGVF